MSNSARKSEQYRSIVLASRSQYRLQQLKQIGVSPQILPSDIDETPIPSERATDTALRLAKLKALKAKSALPQGSNSIIIASDQTAEVDHFLLGKPGSVNAANKQLTECSGKLAHFYSALYVIGAAVHEAVVQTDVQFRTLTQAQISAYIDKESPLDCAGSFKCEGLGISLFKSIQSSDPSALIGLPLITLTDLLNKEGVDVLTL